MRLEAAADAGTVVKMDETRYPPEGKAHSVPPKRVVFNILPSQARYVARAMIGEKPLALVTSGRSVVYGADAMPAHPGHLRGTAQAGAGVVELLAAAEYAAHPQ